MSEQTKATSEAVGKGNVSAQEQLRRIIDQIELMEEVLLQERQSLRAAAVGLPIGTLQRARQLQARLSELAVALVSRQTELRQLRALAQTTALIGSSLDTSSVLNQVMDTVIQLTGAERGYVMLNNKETGVLEFRVARGIDREQLSRDEFTVSNTIINEVFTTRMPVLTDNAHSDPRYQSMESIIGYQLRSILAVPLIVRGEVIGVVYCDNKVMTALFKDSELNLLTAFANQAAVAIENARLFESARARLSEITEMRDLVDSVFSSVISGLITLDGRDVITAFNQAAETISRVTALEAIGAPIFAVLPHLRPALSEALEQIRAGETQASVEINLTLKDVGRHIVNITINPLRGADGSGGGVVLVLEDLTELRAREAQIAQAQRYVPLGLVENMNSAAFGALDGQLREITVVFADVRGFTSFSEQLEPELLMRIINKYLSLASDSVNLHEGVVDKYLGDAVTGLFNTQLNPQENDHAVRALRAALSIMYDVTALHEILPPEQQLFFGIGIHTGQAILGTVGSQDRREFAAIGDAVEFAKLLQENAGRGDVIISAETYEQVRAYFECEAITPSKTRDRQDFTIMYRVLGRKR